VALRFALAYVVPRLGEYLLSRMGGTAGAEGIVRTTLERCTVDISRIDPAVVTATIALEAERMQHPSWHEAVVEGSRSIVQTLFARGHVQRWIRGVTTPTLLMHGRQDRVVTVRAARAAAELRADWEYVELDGAGHIPMMEVPRQFLDVTRQWMAGDARTAAGAGETEAVSAAV